MGLFGRRRPQDPASWDELWEVLTPLGGRLDPVVVARWRDHVARSAPAVIEAAGVQVGHAYRLLGTEAHARLVGPGAFDGVDRPFAAGRFARVVDAVVVAGPDAVARVAADPEAIRSYSAGVPLLDPVEAYRPGGQVALGIELLRVLELARLATGAELRAPRGIFSWTLTPTSFDRAALREWPSLRGRRPDAALRGIRDPEEPWLELDASNLDPAPDPAAVPAYREAGPAPEGDGPTDWYALGSLAAERIVAALGPDVLVGRPTAVVMLEVVRPTADEDGPQGGGSPDDDAPSDWGGGALLVPVRVDLADTLVTDDDARVGVLVRASARRLLRLDEVVSDATRPVLETLAAGGAPV
ncbi:hypothetical protein [Luteimicrobium subarcticum]|uniref:Uncharacterized protein n=1 Tax=Luteimicrobium subarcticum TaxID=620910 RepID=A0A2M8WS96_9MICO|nr:hypothetical protein [Luteimicrobium subarcticum]PJI93817.1 hypothetical protein CLV34_1292 [Luteimicrobium subarcticum]